MKFKNYCLVVMGDTIGVTDEIKKVSETEPNILDAKGILLATFSSVATLKELESFFKLSKRSFLIFDLSEDSSSCFIIKKEIHEGLFGFLKTINNEDKTTKLIREINMTADTKSNSNKGLNQTIVYNPKKLTENDVENMSKTEKDDLWNKLIDNGVENLTDDDKKILLYLSK